jgi:hypothetical protein
MDYNLSGAIAANVSLMQSSPPHTDYTPLVIALITATAGIVGTLLGQHLQVKSEERRLKLQDEIERSRTIEKEREQFLKNYKQRYYTFIEIFSKPYQGSLDLLNSAIAVAELGDMRLSETLSIDENRINSLDDLIDVMIEWRIQVRYSSIPTGSVTREAITKEQEEMIALDRKFDDIRIKAAEAFIPIMRDKLKKGIEGSYRAILS